MLHAAAMYSYENLKRPLSRALAAAGDGPISHSHPATHGVAEQLEVGAPGPLTFQLRRGPAGSFSGLYVCLCRLVYANVNS